MTVNFYWFEQNVLSFGYCKNLNYFHWTDTFKQVMPNLGTQCHLHRLHGGREFSFVHSLLLDVGFCLTTFLFTMCFCCHRVFEYLQKSDVLNCQHSQSGFMCTSFANKAALWQMYGKR